MKRVNGHAVVLLLAGLLTSCAKEPNPASGSDTDAGGKPQVRPDGESGAYIVAAADGRLLRVRPYGEAIVRLQAVRAGESFFQDDRYEMVESHDWPGSFEVDDRADAVTFATQILQVDIDKETLGAAFYLQGTEAPLLNETPGVSWQGTNITVSFATDSTEHFAGLGHGYFAREDSLDLRGRVVRRNYGRKQIEQAPLIVPFFMSSKGYGLFLNSTFPNTFKFAANGKYEMSIDDHGFGGRMDYFFIAGPRLTSVLDRYTSLTGRPRLPMKSMFGLQLSDKAHDHDSDTPSDERWWKNRILEHRAGGFPVDHVVNDNRWRAGGGKRCESRIEWDPERYPDPAAYKEWLDENGLVTTVDFNRCIARFSDGWNTDFNLPQPGEIDFEESAPDLTNAEFRKWFWDVFYEKTLDPKLNFPGDALWIDEFDEQGAAPMDMVLANGKSSAEMRNYWFFLIAKALVQEGWDASDIERRPFVWVRGMTAGAQRYATLWSGDIYPDYRDMRGQIRSMQLAGLSGFPFWGHDAGGFYDWDAGVGPDENMYMQWAMAFGSFAPVWKPHGMGKSRWPLDRSDTAQAVAEKFSRRRYELMPYTYSAAHQAAESGLPIARAMILEHQQNLLAWKHDLQYLWGDSLLIAPNTTDNEDVEVWLPEGNWYEYEGDRPVEGGKVLKVAAGTGHLPVFVKAGAIIPKRDFALSTGFISKEILKLDVYAGADGAFRLIEDDDRTEAYRRNDERMITDIEYDDERKQVTIYGSVGTYQGAPTGRTIGVRILGLGPVATVLANGKSIEFHETGRRVSIDLPSFPVDREIVIEFHL